MSPSNDHVSCDFEPECSCDCRYCRRGDHYLCNAVKPCAIASTCQDCDCVECICDAPDPDDGGVEDVEIDSLPGDDAMWFDGNQSEFPSYPKEAL